MASATGDSLLNEYNEAAKLTDDINEMISEKTFMSGPGAQSKRHFSSLRRKIAILGTRLDSLESVLAASYWLTRKWNSTPVVIAGAADEEYQLTIYDVDSSIVFMYPHVTKAGIKGAPRSSITDFIKAAVPPMYELFEIMLKATLQRVQELILEDKKALASMLKATL